MWIIELKCCCTKVMGIENIVKTWKWRGGAVHRPHLYSNCVCIWLSFFVTFLWCTYGPTRHTTINVDFHLNYMDVCRSQFWYVGLLRSRFADRIFCLRARRFFLSTETVLLPYAWKCPTPNADGWSDRRYDDRSDYRWACAKGCLRVAVPCPAGLLTPGSG